MPRDLQPGCLAGMRARPGWPASEWCRTRPGPRPRIARREEGIAFRETSAHASASVVTSFHDAHGHRGADIASERGLLKGKKTRIRRSSALISRQLPGNSQSRFTRRRCCHAAGPAVASQPPGPGASRGGGRVNWTDPGGTGVFLTTPRAGDRAGISIYPEQHGQGLRRDRRPHVRAGQVPQGLRTLCRQSRRNNAEYPVRYGSHG
jgi:hypothetical protein